MISSQVYFYCQWCEIFSVDYTILEKHSSRHALKHRIFDLVVTFNDGLSDKFKQISLINIYPKIFALFANLNYLRVNTNGKYTFIQSILRDLPPTTCSSSNIVHLHIKMHNFDDCLSLLDGRLSQLRTLILDLDYIRDSFLIRHNRARELINTINTVNKSIYFNCSVYC